MLTFRRRRLPSRYGAVLMPLLLSILMTGIVSFVASVKHFGLHDGLVPLWLGAWEVSWLIAYPALLLVLPVVRWLTAMLVEPPHTGDS
jgi:Protein of unknown function (DUF2798)